ncbi:MAG: hypothetical protein LBE81_09515 [Azonexus sp.]|jgi:multidrug resistance efflux pump|uniref:hypothetical protein n=1 Tax=Azonexus sp. TaxID=1872668 RepID=UPI00282CF197|nr:hypothetical protein [Azonexus sp.]MDR0776858.1 hypothetical protein [Azonexus sp.]
MSTTQKVEALKAQQAKLDEALKAKKAKIAQRISHLKSQQSKAERNADGHVKKAIGGAVLAILQAKSLPQSTFDIIFQEADVGVQKQGLGREKFNALRSALKPPTVETAQ